ncbi:MAG: acyl--CoA ligase [Candidatus Melainabacteria bacterium]|nr:acyl--CoA ligase [Candidatus Melainabacteria bacterium]
MSGLIRSLNHDFMLLAEQSAQATALTIRQDVDCKNISYSDLTVLVSRCLAFFESHGLSKGDVVFVLLPNSSESAIVFLACLLGGLTFAPLPCTASQPEIRRWIELTNPKYCLLSSPYNSNLSSMVEEAGVRCFNIETDAEFSWLPEAAERVFDSSEARIFLSTSGTTGEPKAMVISADRLWSSGHAFLKYHNLLNSRLRFWNYLPMSYLGGLFNLLLVPLASGGSTVIDQSFSGKTFLEFWQTVERFEIDSLWLVPTIVRGLLELSQRTRKEDLSKYGQRIRAAFVGTAPLDLETKRRFERTFGVAILENFALSETTFFTSETLDNLDSRTEGSTGEVLPYSDIKFSVLDHDVADLTEILVKSPFLFLGYLQNDGTVSLPLDADGYFATGDLGHLTSENVMVIDGRIKDVVKKGGYMVSLREVETIAEQHHAVKQATAAVVPHSFYGESFYLYLILKSEVEESNVLAQIESFIHEHLVRHKWPEKVFVVREFPVTASGKVQKFRLSQGLNEVNS